ncbi:MAG: glycosyltransferase [Bacteroidales bacterium]|jgi:glycosyltransferase involved in cell wall biosynthesis
MKVLIVCSGNFSGKFEHAQVFIYEQMEELRKQGVTCDIFLIKGKGAWGYINNVLKLNRLLLKKKYDLVHAVYGLSGLIALLQFRAKVITTFIGSDINNTRRIIPKLVARFSDFSIFVEKAMPGKINCKNKYLIVPFGLDMNFIKPEDKEESRKIMDFKPDEKIILFCSSFNRPEKNYSLASQAIKMLPYPIKVVELGKSYSREEVSRILNSSDVVLMTSLHEGSPQLIKEAMACNIPVVSTDVGDVREIIGDTGGTYICTYDPMDVAEKIRLALHFAETNGRTKGRERIIRLGLDNKVIAGRINEVYNAVLSGNKI